MGRRRSGSENRVRDNIVPLRVDDAERAAIRQAAQEEGIYVSELVRRAVFRDIGYLPTGAVV